MLIFHVCRKVHSLLASKFLTLYHSSEMVECVWNLMAHGDARVRKWSGNWRMEWVASTLTLPRNVVYPALLTRMRTLRLPAVDWTDASANLNGLVRFGERRNLVSARVSSRFKRTIQFLSLRCLRNEKCHISNRFKEIFACTLLIFRWWIFVCLMIQNNAHEVFILFVL